MQVSRQTARGRPHQGRILVADDDPVLRELAAGSLASAGYRVETAVNGVEAINKLGAQPFDVVVTDLAMPEIDGFGVIEHVRLNERNQHMPIIVITTNDDFASIEHAFAAGATSFQSKPINWTLFGHHMRYVLKAHRREAELRHAKEEVEAASRLKSNLLSVMTHEFRTPLHVALGFTELFVKEVEGPLGSPKYLEYAHHINGAAKQLSNVLGDILLFSRWLSNELTLSEDCYEIGQLLGEAEDAGLPNATAQGIRVTRAEKLPPGCQLNCDRALFIRAVCHLLDNAVKFSGPGTQVTLSAQQARNGGLICAVQDQGCGMAPETIDGLLKPFAQADMSKARNHEGIGLGLTLCNHIIEAHGGRLIIHSAPGEGTTAGLIFPAARVVESEFESKQVAVA